MLADLKKIPLFEGLPDEDLLMLANGRRSATFRAAK